MEPASCCSTSRPRRSIRGSCAKSAALLRPLDDLKKTLVVVSHDMDFAQAISDQVIYFEGGRAVESGTASEVFSHPQQPETRAFMDSFHDGRAEHVVIRTTTQGHR